MNKNTLKSIGAVLAGFVAVVVLSLGTDVMMHAAGVFPQFGQPMSDALFLLSTLYRTVYCIAGSYIAARLAPDRPKGHALALGVVGLVVSTVGAVVTWNKGPEFGPTGILSRSSSPPSRAPGWAADSASCSCTRVERRQGPVGYHTAPWSIIVNSAHFSGVSR